MQEITRYCDAIAAAFKPQRIILFGSHAGGKPGEESDVDVLIVLRNARRLGRHPAAAIRLKVRADFAVDMLVRDEREVFRRVRERDLFMLEKSRSGAASCMKPSTREWMKNAESDYQAALALARRGAHAPRVLMTAPSPA